MTFEQFQASRVWTENIGAVLADAGHQNPGWLYLGQLFIEDSSRWYLPIANNEFRSNSLEDLERRLYDFAEGEGYFKAQGDTT